MLFKRESLQNLIYSVFLEALLYDIIKFAFCVKSKFIGEYTLKTDE